MKKLLLTTLLALVASAAPAQETLLDLTQKADYDRCTQYTPLGRAGLWAFETYNQYPYLYNYRYSTYNDHLVSPALTLVPGNLYELRTSPAAYSSENTPDIEVRLGTSATPTDNPVIAQYNKVEYAYKTSAKARTATFAVPQGGEYFLSIGANDLTNLYATSIVNLGPSEIPAAPSDLAVYSDGDGVSVEFTAPTQTIAYNPLTTPLPYTVSRADGTGVANGEVTPGEYIKVADTPPAGDITYTLTLENGAGNIQTAYVKGFCGADTPLPPANVAFASAGNWHTVTWNPVTATVNGNALRSSDVTYTIERVVGSNNTLVAEGITDCQYTDEYSPRGLQKVAYAVSATAAGKTSEATASAATTVGTLRMPFADSFAGGEIGKNWDTEVLNGTYNWQGAGTLTTEAPKAEPIDGDGGLAVYHSWTAAKNHSARLATAPISAEDAASAVVQFALAHSNIGADVLKVQISCDGGDWTDIPDAQVVVKKDGVAAATYQWETYTFGLGSHIPAGTGTFRVGLTAVSANGHNIVIDNVRIFRLLDCDLQAVSVTVPETVISGNTLPVTVTIANNGASDVAAGDYTLDIITDLGSEIAIPENQAIPALTQKTFTVNVPVNALHAIAADQYSFAVAIDCAADQDPDNNTCPAAATAITFSQYNSAGQTTATVNDDGSALLEWEPADDPYFVPMAYAEDFTNCETGQHSGFAQGLTVLDLDGRSGGTYHTASSSVFTVNSSTYGNVPVGSNYNNVLAVSVAANAQQDDWIILPQLTGAEGNTYTLSFRVAFKKISYTGHKYEVLYSTGDYDAANPAGAFTGLIKAESAGASYGDIRSDENFWTATYTVPAEARYVALHFNNKISYATAMWVDDISLSENVTAPLQGYHVYRHGHCRVNGELLPPTQRQYLLEPSDNDHSYYVTAVYPEGEAEPSNMVTVATPSGVEDVAVDSAAPTQYYDLQGRHISRPGRGIYIRQQGITVTKILK